MNKIAALYSNEMIKIFHRVSVWIVMVIMLSIAILAPIAFKVSVGDYNDQYDDFESYLSKEEFRKIQQDKEKYIYQKIITQIYLL